ncbi:MAG: tRNA N6-adenosine(37)-N6-threonylcarbamoyltransferase complex dimerization subunit TsaB [Verrucomicrobiaceae bacterium]|nr:tRNA N6-adenosine(37)-N6-threonylcarbamoyltransferase complex dimerization subunit TsaB [Verrucomicrobiaceae bacterium]
MTQAILAIELSTPTGQLAVVRDGTVLFESAFTSNRSHNSMLYAPLGEALAAAGDTLGLIVVGTGPGSYTGVRIGIAAAYGVALSRNVPVMGWSSLTALSPLQDYHVAGDARRGKFYTGQVSQGRMTGPLILHDEAGLRTWHAASDGRPCFTSDAVVPLGLPGIELAQPSAVLLAKLAAGLDALEREGLTAVEIEPVYITEAFITQAKKKQALPP